MKIRQGFVSNSSSSSFVVAFPEQPTSSDDVFQAMFPGGDSEDKLRAWDDDEYKETLGVISESVWNDIQRQVNMTEEEDIEHWSEYDEENPTKKTLLEKVTASFESRYHYMTGTTVDFEFLMKTGVVVEVPLYPRDPKNYFGVNEKEYNKILEIEQKIDQWYKENNREEQRLRRLLDLVKSPYPWKGSEKEKKEAWEIEREIDEKFENSKECRRFRKQSAKQINKLRDSQSKAIQKIALTDAKAFLDDNEDKFILFVEYGDKTRGGTVMEHGEIFRNLPHVRISHH